MLDLGGYFLILPVVNRPLMIKKFPPIKEGARIINQIRHRSADFASFEFGLIFIGFAVADCHCSPDLLLLRS